ncbi:cystatin-A-like [Convolutriloba macropyga]|uniref:cystatin-A-like n=1 Tax=Convolutriloba macropyga TaxID=536237 RepID=UPI003F527DF2
MQYNQLNSLSPSFSIQIAAKLLFLICFVMVTQGQFARRTPGGLSEAKAGDGEAQKIADEVKEAVEEKAESTFPSFEVVSYKTQVVAGTMFYMKVKVDAANYIHVKVFRGLPFAGSKVEFKDYQDGKGEDDEIEYF